MAENEHDFISPLLFSLPLIVNLWHRQRVQRADSAGATATQQVQWLLCISKTHSCELFPLHTSWRKTKEKWLEFYNKRECWCWQTFLMGYSVFLCLLFLFLYHSCSLPNVHWLPHWNPVFRGSLSTLFLWPHSSVRGEVIHTHYFYCVFLKVNLWSFLYICHQLPVFFSSLSNSNRSYLWVKQKFPCCHESGGTRRRTTETTAVTQSLFCCRTPLNVCPLSTISAHYIQIFKN